MDPAQPQTPRAQELIASELDTLTAEPGFIYTFSLMVFEFLWMAVDQMADINWYQRPNSREMSMLLGFLIKQPIDLSSFPSEGIYEVQRECACSLLQEIHLSYAFSPPKSGTSTSTVDTKSPEDIGREYDLWIRNGDGMVEPIFYSGAGAYDFQYLDMTAQRYSSDSYWLEKHLGTDYDAIIQVARQLKELPEKRVRGLKPPPSFKDFCTQILATMSFSASDLPLGDKTAFNVMVDKFALSPGLENHSFTSIGERNVIDFKPMVKLGDGRYFLPLFSNLAEAIYESPFYWMIDDRDYKNTALKHRGDATEIITHNLLSKVFTHGATYRNVNVKRGAKDLTDIDILAVSGNKAVIVQCKSKKLTAKARSGDADSLETDFLKAVQEPYKQGLVAREALLSANAKLTRTDGRQIRLRWPIDEAYVVCVTGDHYPALLAQARAYFQPRDGDPYPVMMTVFDLDVTCFYLSDQFDFLYYLQQRSTHAEYYWTDSEMSILGFHLRHKLFPDDNYTAMLVDSHYAQLIDAHVFAARGGWPKVNSDAELFHDWHNDMFDELVRDVKSVANQPEPEIPVEDILFFLYDVAGKGADQLIREISKCKRLTKRDGKRHVARLKLNGPAGTTFVSFPKARHSLQAESSRHELLAIAMLHKYQSKADKWLVLASFEGSPVSFELFGFIEEPWKYDDQLEQAVKRFAFQANPQKASTR